MIQKNQVVLDGMAFKPKYQIFTSGTPMLQFSMSFGNRKNEKTNTWEGSWIDVKAFKEVANENQMLENKSKISIQGFLKQESWTDTNGKMQSKIVVIATRIFTIDLQTQTIASALEYNEDNIPF